MSSRKIQSHPTFTIVTPSFNQAKYLEQAVLSVLEQRYPAIQYVIMDGGSSDGSVEIIQRYSEKLHYWSSGRDSGQADALSKGFAHGNGEILGWLNSDDLLLPGSLEKVAQYFTEHPDVICVVGGAVTITENGCFRLNRFGRPSCNLGVDVTFNRLLLWGCDFKQPSTFWRRSAFEASGGCDASLKFCMDYDLYLRLSKTGRFGRIRDWLSCFRMHSDSKTTNLQRVRQAEDEMLWRRYGKYEVQPIVRRIAWMWYLQDCVVAWLWLHFTILIGLRRLPILRPAAMGSESDSK